MLFRIEKAKAKGVPITNYGVAISFVQGVLERTLVPFPAALAAYRETLANTGSLRGAAKVKDPVLDRVKR